MSEPVVRTQGLDVHDIRDADQDIGSELESPKNKGLVR